MMLNAFYRFLVLAVVLVALSGCDNAPKWTAEELKDAAHLRASLTSFTEAFVYERTVGRGDQDGILKLIGMYESAYGHCQLVPDATLSKISRGLGTRWHSIYRKGLELKLAQLSGNGDSRTGYMAAEMLRRFAAWLEDNRAKIRIPKEDAKPRS